jgi:hypothetical protein
VALKSSGSGVKRFEEGNRKGGNTQKTLRGNPETFSSQRFRIIGKVTNLERGGRLERVKPTFLLVIL